METTEKLPERINVMKVISYDVQEIVNKIIEDGSTEDGRVSLWDIMQQVEAWTESDFGCEHGHESDLSDLIFQDENGEELNW